MFILLRDVLRISRIKYTTQSHTDSKLNREEMNSELAGSISHVLPYSILVGQNACQFIIQAIPNSTRYLNRIVCYPTDLYNSPWVGPYQC